jgi:hypothetical protein
MRHQAISKIALMLSVLFIGAASAQASPVRYGDIIAMATVAGQSGRPSVDLRMRPSGQQTAGSAQQTASTKGAPAQEQKQSNAPDVATTSAPATSNSASLTDTEVAPQQPAQQTNVETVNLGEVQGTICDCGAIRIPGGFPKWPLLALGGIPFLFINHGCDTTPCEEVFPPPTPTPPGVPEPATIFLLGTGLAALGARARRAYSRRDNNNDSEATGEV